MLRAWLATFVLACGLAPGGLRAAEAGEEAALLAPEGDAPVGFDFSLRLSNRFNWKRNFLNPEGSLTSARGGGVAGGGGGGSATVYEDPLNLRFNQEELGYSVFLGAAGRLRIGESVQFGLGLDSGEVKFPATTRRSPRPVCGQGSPEPACRVTSNGRFIGDEGLETGFVREAFLQLELGPGGFLSLSLGKRLVSLGGSFVLDTHALGLSLEADLDQGFELPWRARLDALLADGSFTAQGKRSPYLQLETAYLFSFLEELGLFVGWYHDGDSSLASIMHAVLSEAALAGGWSARPLYLVLQDPATRITSRGELFWVGVSGRVVFDAFSLGGTAALSAGTFDLLIEGTTLSGEPFRRQARPIALGGMLDVDLLWDLTDALSLGVFFLFQSGETFGPDDMRDGLLGRYSSFLSIYPHITRTNLFFSGGLNETFSARSFSTSGVNGRGVLAPGLSLGWDIASGLEARVVSALLFSHGAHLTSGSRFYGWESDLVLRWSPVRYVTLMLEADYLWTGGFFDFPKPIEALRPQDQALAREPDAWKLLIGLDLAY
jgi:hypothetical protein